MQSLPDLSTQTLYSSLHLAMGTLPQTSLALSLIPYSSKKKSREAREFTFPFLPLSVTEKSRDGLIHLPPLTSIPEIPCKSFAEK